MKGDTSSVGVYSLTWALTYVDVPLLVRYRIPGTGGEVSTFVFGGPIVGVLLNAKTSQTFAGYTTGSDLTSTMSRMELGLAIGGGMQIRRLSVEWRYTLGLTDTRGGDPWPASKLSEKNRALAMMVGMRF